MSVVWTRSHVPHRLHPVTLVVCAYAHPMAYRRYHSLANTRVAPNYCSLAMCFYFPLLSITERVEIDKGLVSLGLDQRLPGKMFRATGYGFNKLLQDRWFRCLIFNCCTWDPVLQLNFLEIPVLYMFHPISWKFPDYLPSCLSNCFKFID